METKMDTKNATFILKEVKKFLRDFWSGDEQLENFVDTIPLESIQNMSSVPQEDGYNLYCLNIFVCQLNIIAKVGEKTDVSRIIVIN